MLHTVTHFFWHTNPLLVCLIVATVLALESSGIPIANTTLLLLAGALAAQGRLNIGGVAFAAIAGSISGACLAYLLGKWGGRPILLRVVTFFHVDAQKVDVVEGWFQRSGGWMIFFSRMTPYVRPFACFPAGISQMNIIRFLIAAASGSIIWCSVALAIGWNLGRRWQLAVHLLMRYTLPTLGILALLIAVYLLASHAIRNYLDARLQAHLRAAKADEEEKKRSHDLLEV